QYPARADSACIGWIFSPQSESEVCGWAPSCSNSRSGRCCLSGIRPWKKPSRREEPMKPPIEPENNPTVAHEPTDADSRSITQFGIGLTFFLILSQLALWWVFSSFKKREKKRTPPVPAIIRTQAPKEPPEPRLQANP